MYQYLNFFNKKGEYCNFSYDSVNDKWVGRVDFRTVSTGIAEDFQIYIMEEVLNTSSGLYEFVYPLIEQSLFSPSNTEANIVNAYFDPKNPVDDIFIYDFILGSTTNVLNKVYNMEYSFEYDMSQTIASNNSPKPEIKETTNCLSKAMQINVGFQPTDEIGYSSVLYLKDSVGHIFAEILFYGEGEEEDERLRDLLVNMGQDLFPSDIKIFDTFDINESEVDWRLLNYKRKELLLEYSNIFPYVGSYKALINIIKFFGYQNLRMKEYWLNVDASSVYYGKYKQIDITDVFDEKANYITSGLVPSKIYKKTSKFGLFYDITIPSGEFDEDGVPIVEEVFTFSPEEVLIKIFALKKKLQNYFLPVNARIIDIIGEAVFFAKYEANIWNDQYRIDDVKLGLKPAFSVLPSREGYIEDLRSLNYYGCPVGSDLTIGGYTNLLSWRIVLSSNDVNVGDLFLDRIQTYRQVVEIPNGGDIYTIDTVIQKDYNTGQVIYKNWEVANKIIDSWKSISYINDNFNVYQEGGTSGAIRIVQKNPLGEGTVFCDWFSDTNPGPATTTQYLIPAGEGSTPYINVTAGPSGTFGPSGAPMSYFADSFLGYFDNTNTSVINLNDDEDIPVGYPIVLRNDTFNITWDDADTNFNQIDRNDPTSNGRLYAKYNFSTDPGFPLVNPTFPNQNTFSWINLGYYGYYQMQWIVTKIEDETPAFRFDSGQKPIEEINSLPLILPYVGKYKVELYLWDGYNTMSFLINADWITVSMYDSDFIGWYQKRELEYNLNTNRYKIQHEYAKPIGPELNHVNPQLSWNEYASTWDLPLHPNEAIGMADLSFHSLDSIEFYQSILNPSDNPLIDRYPYTYNLITQLPSWEDLYHLWWDGIGTRLTQWEINSLSGISKVMLYMTKGNTNINLDEVDCFYCPFNFYGSEIALWMPGNNPGDVLVTNPYFDKITVYIWDGSDWRISKEMVDAIEITLPVGNDIYKFLSLVDHLNNTLPNDYRQHPYLLDFIYYLDREYNFDPLDYSLNPYMRAVSKNPDKGGRHQIKYVTYDYYDNLVDTNFTKSYETVYFGYLGDIPTSFEIYYTGYGDNKGIKLEGMDDFYPITSSSIWNLANELNGATAQSYNKIGDYTYNLVKGYPGWDGTGDLPNPPSYDGTQAVKVIATSKKFVSPQTVNIEYRGGVIGTNYARSVIKNPTFDQIRILKYTEELPLCTVVNFTYDNSKVKGKKNPIWKMTKEGDPDFDDIYYNNKFFSYMFTERGSYSISLQIEDTNGNKQTVSKTEIIKII